MFRLLVLAVCVGAFAACSQTTSKMVCVEGGSFRMGDTFGDGKTNEGPVHEVSLRTFLIGKYEVTVGEFREFVEETGYVTVAEKGEGCLVIKSNGRVEKEPDASWRNVYREQGERHPVVSVSWYDAIAYCNWRSRREGAQPCYSGTGDAITCDFNANGYRLATEAEWEYAARSGGKKHKYAWGNGQPYVDGRAAANIRDEAAKRAYQIENVWEAYDDGYPDASPVGSFASNSLEVHDMSGNVYEWCWDWWHEDYYGRSPSDDPTGPTEGVMRACRDVGYGCPAPQIRVTSRGKGKPSLCFGWGGFRLVRSVQ
jgi:formylglycine-generating enzyme required for sulfatase activity